MSQAVEIMMPLLNEGVAVWRPLYALTLSADRYTIQGQMPEGEEWAFMPGSAVRVEIKAFADGTKALAAVQLSN